MSVADENREFVVRVKPANRAGLFLSEIDAAIRGADETVSIVGSLPHELPFEATGNYSWNLRSGHVLGGGRLSEFLSASGISLLLLLLCDGDPAQSYSRCNETASDGAHSFQFHKGPPNGLAVNRQISIPVFPAGGSIYRHLNRS
jgi:hypothetical protein